MSYTQYDKDTERFERLEELADKTDLESQIAFMELNAHASPVADAILGSLNKLKAFQPGMASSKIVKEMDTFDDRLSPCACPQEHHRWFGSDAQHMHYRCELCRHEFKV